jgi:5,6,7,8-tetrahydromethanopterin hydro-lyase
VAAFLTQLGEAFVGTGPEAAHVNTALGAKGGQVETAWVTALATPREGHVAFVVAAQPGLAVKPMTLFVNKATIASDAHAQLTWGPAQAGVASGVLDALVDGTVAPASVDELVLVVAVWVAPAASDPDAVYRFNRAATRDSLRAGALRQPSVGDVLSVRDEPFNAHWLPPTMRRSDERSTG